MANEDKKIVSVEGLKKVREKLDQKYVIEGEYSPNTSVGLSRLAENLTPYSPSSGTAQDIPFISQGTGCGNGSTQVDTGSYGQIMSKNGFGLVVNQLVNTGDAEVSTENGRKYWTYINNTYAIVTSTGSPIAINDDSIDKVVDLTLMYGNNAWIPSDLLSHPENFYRYYQGSLAYNIGTLVHSDGRYLVTTGFNQFEGNSTNNPQYIGDYYIDGDYNRYSQNSFNCFRIKILANNAYCLSRQGNILGTAAIVRFVDKNFNLISGNKSGYSLSKIVLTPPTNCEYIEFAIGKTSTALININLSYNGERDGEYEPYEELDIIDTGTEDLLQAGEASDTKAKDGTITHNLVEINLAEKTWTLVEEAGYWYFVGSSPSNIRSVGSANLPNAHSDKYVTVKMNDAGLANNTFAIDEQFILVRTSSTSVTPTGTIIAELDESTTEQGTPYESTINLNDFGTMYWLTSGNASPSIPQGLDIFYSVDYKAYVDSLIIHTDGDASNVATTDELGEKETELKAVDTILQNAIGGTLRQLLAVSKSIDFDDTAYVDLGGLDWNRESIGDGKYRYYALLTNAKISDTTNGVTSICTQYSPLAQGQTSDNSKTGYTIALGSNLYFHIYENDELSTTAFKTAMKGVLLAYEKA